MLIIVNDPLVSPALCVIVVRIWKSWKAIDSNLVASFKIMIRLYVCVLSMLLVSRPPFSARCDVSQLGATCVSAWWDMCLTSPFSIPGLNTAVEWGFGKIVQLFAFVNFHKNQKLYLQPVGKYYRVATLLTNCHTCMLVRKSSFNILWYEPTAYHRLPGSTKSASTGKDATLSISVWSMRELLIQSAWTFWTWSVSHLYREWVQNG